MFGRGQTPGVWIPVPAFARIGLRGNDTLREAAVSVKRVTRGLVLHRRHRRRWVLLLSRHVFWVFEDFVHDVGEGAGVGLDGFDLGVGAEVGVEVGAAAGMGELAVGWRYRLWRGLSRGGGRCGMKQFIVTGN